MRPGRNAMVVFMCSMLVASMIGGFVWLVPEASAYTPHAPIVISGDADFTPANGVTGGFGTESEPYLISGWEIETDTTDGIYISGTDAHFLISDVFIHGNMDNYGIHIAQSRNGTVSMAMLVANYAGVYFDTTSRMAVENSSISWNYYGVETYYATDLQIIDNMMDGNENSIYADYGLNNLTCIRNSMDGNEYDAFYVYGDLVNALIRDCTMRYVNYGWGMYVDGSISSTEISNCVIVENFYGGIYAYDPCEDLTIRGNNVSANGEQGIYMSYGGDNCSIEDNSIVLNSDEGVYLGSGGYYGSNSILSNIIIRNDDFGIYCEALGTYISKNRVSLQTDGGGVSIQNDDIRVENNTIEDNAEYGVYVGSGSARARVANNTFSMCGLFVDFAYSPGVTISDNSVNGLPLLFLNGVSGASVSSGVGQVIALDSSDIRISDMDLSRATVGVEFWNTDNSVIERLTVMHGVFGVFVKNYSIGVSIQDSDLSRNDYGAWVDTGCVDNQVVGCDLSHSKYIGVGVELSSSVFIVDNQMINCSMGVESMNSYGVVVSENNISWSTSTSVYTVNGYDLEITDNEIFSSGTGIMLYGVSTSTVSWNQVTACSNAAFVQNYGDENEVSNNTFNSCKDGVYIEGSIFQYTMRNVVKDNEIQGNSRYGVFLNYAEANTVCRNNVTDNAWGIYISGTHTPRNWIYLNNFDNPINAYSAWSGNNNYWNTSTMVEYWWDGMLWTGYLGNYWSDYSGSDADNNGVGDTPYAFTSEQDSYPLMDESLVVIPEYEGLVLPALALLCMLFVLAKASRPRRGR